MRRGNYFLAVITAALLNFISFTQAQSQTCSASSKCPKSSPCCGFGGTCGSGSLQCAGGCNPMSSYSATSCLPNPICTNKNITFSPTDYNNPNMFWPILLYNGNSSLAPFTLDYGYLGKGPTGVLLELTQGSQTKISTTDYMLYGSMQITARHNAMAGLVFAFITMSDTKDEIDWEFTTSSGSDAQTNYFSQGVVASGTAESITNLKNNFDVSDWHTYGLNWQPNQLQWSIDGQTVRTVKQSVAGDNYPRSPSRIQVSVWAGGNSTNPEGVIQWSGGPIDWTSSNYTNQGFYSAEIQSFQTSCASQSSGNVNTVGSGNTTTSWIYTGQNSSSLGEPGYQLSTDPINFISLPSQDGQAGLPGYSQQSAFTKSNSNAWDGSGDTNNIPKTQLKSVNNGGSSNSNSGSSNNSGGWLDNNKILSIAVPVVAGLVGLAVIWGLCVWLYRRMRKRTYNNELGRGELAKSGVALNAGRRGGGSSAFGSTLDKGTHYEALDEDDDDGSSSVNEGKYSDPVPMGAQKVGRGYGPAPGPRPGPMSNKEWSNSATSVYGGKGDEYAMSESNLLSQRTQFNSSPPKQQQQQRSQVQFQPTQRSQIQFQSQRVPATPLPQPQSYPSPYPIQGHPSPYPSQIRASPFPAPQQQQLPQPQASPYPSQIVNTPQTPYSPYSSGGGGGGVRGPYTPGMNAFTPAVHQTPAALQSGAFGSPQRMHGFDQQQQQQQQQQRYPRYHGNGY